MTTFEPGARLALTQGLVVRPCSTAFLASSPAATITEGFDVLVQLVIAAITTEPWLIVPAERCCAAAVRADPRRRSAVRRPLRRRTARASARLDAGAFLAGAGRRAAP